MVQLENNSILPSSIGSSNLLSTDYVITRGNKAQSLRLRYIDTSQDIDYLVEVIAAEFGSKWKRIEESINFEYLVLQAGGKVVDIAVDKNDKATNDRKITGNIQLAGTNTDTEKASTLVETEDNGVSEVYGFNSITPVPTDTDKALRTVKGSADDNTVSRDGSRSSTQDNTENTTENNSFVSNKQSVYTEKKQADNYQEWIEKEISLRRYVLKQEVFKDLDTILASSIYD